MAALDDADALATWEKAVACPTPLRGAALLQLAGTDEDEDQCAALPLGEAARRLLELHARRFGRTLSCVAECPACGTALEADCDAHTLAAQASSQPAGDSRCVAAAGFAARVRLPSMLDLAQAARTRDVAEARRVLLERCVIEAIHDDTPCAAADLPQEVTFAIAAALEDADPLADIGLAFQCPACDTAWTATLDPARFVLAAVERAAQAVMLDVHALALAYGWTEAETLALGRARRRAYLELAGR